MPKDMTDTEILDRSILIPCKGEDDKHGSKKNTSHPFIYWTKGWEKLKSCPLCEQIEKRKETVERIKTLGEKLEGPTAR